ncbi:hydroxyproline O-galactosyltransferase GALT6 isoform X2 [Physcomitrium patens]|uniref:Galectin domain-containing protein n=1 Tax=Physcomitrium patens TaxID=3218 RepID=A0A2K1LBK7_PHYPA|nr:hydroxyproline O-galactosyltransferase GALT6-like [Physcomitrium patens]PNR63414.1 hypothetical protein PHYPA_001840 [Physcomitrium patens]|eukprot:XP_024385161.1 hydroxyproline O-galactosyltransferase GALT6-like [Physcomitrella patens]
MKRGSRLPDMACTGRQRNDLILVAIVCLFFMVIFIPPYLQMNSLPDIDSPVEKLEDDDDAVFTSHRRRNQEQISVVTDSGQRRTVMPSSTGAEDVTNAPSKDSQDSDKKSSSYSKKTTLEANSKEERRSPGNTTGDIVSLDDVIDRAWSAGAKAWEELETALRNGEGVSKNVSNATANADPCPASLSAAGKKLDELGKVFPLPCGLMFGSAITLIGKPREAHMEYKPPIARVGEGVSPYVMVSQFLVELQGLKVVKGEDPPRILHLNPRLRGDWSWKPIIEHNTCYRNQWGPAHRCEGWQVPEYEETVDGLPKCEKWLRDDGKKPASTQKSWWLGRLVGRSDKETLEWEYPLSEGREFVLTIRAGVEGFHVTIDGRHISSFPYRVGYAVEETTGILVAGDVDVMSITVTSLPLTHPSYYPELVLESGDIWKAPPVPATKIDLFIGIMSSSNHFAERMAVRKTWFQSKAIQSSQAVARFFVALHANKDINMQLKKEADYYGDIIILPFIDRYDIVVLKTVEICKFGVQNVTAKYIMKCDDDTFVRIDSVLEEIRTTSISQGLYMGSMNEFHRPLRSGKWAVTAEEWPERIYPIYANGPGYILSEDIVHFIVEMNERGSLQLFKMEDVSVGIWVREYAKQVKHVQYEHSIRFAQAGCIPKYLTAHYQSPRQMLCLWDKVLAHDDGKCCNL